MKKYILFIILLLMACNKSNDNEVNTGTYIMELEKEKYDSDKKILPTISVDTNKKEFTFSYDMLSSYFTIGTYEINDNILTATTNDDKYHYTFEIIDKNTLCFMEEESSKITVIDKNFCVVPQNAAIFKIKEK
ncbi:hypothetical protein AAK894_01125 [Lachnospiraceae bacterium 46-61]